MELIRLVMPQSFTTKKLIFACLGTLMSHISWVYMRDLKEDEDGWLGVGYIYWLE